MAVINHTQTSVGQMTYLRLVPIVIILIVTILPLKMMLYPTVGF